MRLERSGQRPHEDVKQPMGHVPLALGIGEGGELLAPMARVITGGLTSSTLITPVFVRVIYTILEERAGRSRERKAARGAVNEPQTIESAGD